MTHKLRTTRSKINLLNAQVAQLHNSALFTPDEISRLTAPLVAQVHALNNEIHKLETMQQEQTSEALTTPQTIS